MTRSRSVAILLPLLLVLATGCGGAEPVAPAVTAPPAAAVPAAGTPAAPGTGTAAAAPAATQADPAAYCDAVRQSIAARPAGGAFVPGEPQPAMQAYASALERVVATSPAESRAFWDATLRLTRTQAAGGTPQNSDGAQVFRLLPPAGAQTQQLCGVDIMDS